MNCIHDHQMPAGGGGFPLNCNNCTTESPSAFLSIFAALLHGIIRSLHVLPTNKEIRSKVNFPDLLHHPLPCVENFLVKSAASVAVFCGVNFKLALSLPCRSRALYHVYFKLPLSEPFSGGWTRSQLLPSVSSNLPQVWTLGWKPVAGYGMAPNGSQ